MKHVMIALVRFYQKTISPLKPKTCRFTPSCSAYAIEAFEKRGFFAGFILTVWRILRCNPFCKGGYDPVPERGFKRVKTDMAENVQEHTERITDALDGAKEITDAQVTQGEDDDGPSHLADNAVPVRENSEGTSHTEEESDTVEANYAADLPRDLLSEKEN